MPPRVTPGPVQEDTCITEAVCIHTKKIYDSCRDKDCVENLVFYPTLNCRPIVECATAIRPVSAKLVYVASEVEEVTFNRGYYTVDLRFYYKITGEASTPSGRCTVTGYSVYDKRLILFGSEGSAKIFSSSTKLGGSDQPRLSSANLPTAVVEAVDPVLLNMRLVDGGECLSDHPVVEIPGCVAAEFDCEVVLHNLPRRILVTLGQFSIVRLERDSKLLIPVYDYCMPEKECVSSSEDDPCSLFGRIEFPVDEFFPPDCLNGPEGYREALGSLQVK